MHEDSTQKELTRSTESEACTHEVGFILFSCHEEKAKTYFPVLVALL